MYLTIIWIIFFIDACEIFSSTFPYGGLSSSQEYYLIKLYHPPSAMLNMPWLLYIKFGSTVWNKKLISNEKKDKLIFMPNSIQNCFDSVESK